MLKHRWYKKGIDIQNIDTVFDSSGISKNTSNVGYESLALPFMRGIRDLRQDDLVQNFEIEHTITKRQIYGECAVLGRKLALLASEFNLTHIAATLQGLIQQVEQSTSTFLRIGNQEMVQNPLQTNSKGRPTK